MRILLIAATSFELAPTLDWLAKNLELKEDRFIAQNWEIVPFVAGVGLISTTYQLQRKLNEESVDLAIQAGIAGSFRRDWPLGKVVQVISERFGDLGAEEANSSFLDLTEMGLLEADMFPFSGAKLHQPEEPLGFLAAAHAISVNKVHGSEQSINSIHSKYEPDLESMEGAAFFYVCLMEKIRFLQLRSISNYVEPRNRENWKIGLSIDTLNSTLIELLSSLLETVPTDK